MQLQRNEIMTGLLVIATIAALAFLLVLLGAPGLFRPLVTYNVYFDNAAGIKQGAPVMLAGRKIGQVQNYFLRCRRKKRSRRRKQKRPFIHRERMRVLPQVPRRANRDSKCVWKCRWTRRPECIATPARV